MAERLRTPRQMIRIVEEWQGAVRAHEMATASARGYEPGSGLERLSGARDVLNLVMKALTGEEVFAHLGYGDSGAAVELKAPAEREGQERKGDLNKMASAGTDIDLGHVRYPEVRWHDLARVIGGVPIYRLRR